MDHDLNPPEFRDLGAAIEAATTDAERVALLKEIVLGLIHDKYPEGT